jgi:PAS domain S-box-containing protein
VLVLAASMAITYYSWKSAWSDSQLRLKNSFDYRALNVTDRLDERLLSYEQVLVGVQALFSDSLKMNPGDFHSYISALHLSHTFPGIHNLMFAKIAPSLGIDISKAVYIEQFPGRNLLAFGHDILSDTKVHSAIEEAINTGKITVTGSLPMAPGGNGLKQSGFLMFVPVYIPGSKHDTRDERRAKCIGWVSGLFLMNDLMAGILDENSADLDIEIFYGKEISESALMYDTDYSRADSRKNRGWYKSIHQVSVSGYPWTLEITSLPGFESRLDQSKPLLVAGTGMGITVLLAILVWVLVRGRANAFRYAAELDASEAQLHAILDNSPIGIWYSGTDGRYRFVNKTFCKAFGMTEQQFLIRRPSEIFRNEDSQDFSKTSQFCLENETSQLSRETLTFADGKPHLLEITRVMLVDDNGMNVGTIGIMNDITEASALQDALKKSHDELEARVQERTRDLEATAKKLEQEMQERKKLERSLLEVSEEAQAQIGRELHDDLGQLLSGAAYLAGSLVDRLANIDPDASKQAETIKKIAQDAVKRTRYITHGLIPFNISSRGLKQGLEQFAEDVLIISGIPCEVQCTGDNEVADLMIATNLYRIAQEAINNAVKHSKASHLFINLNTDANEIRLTIVDDGVGLPSDFQGMSKGMGLLNMNYRAQLIGATIKIHSNEGKGTSICLNLPIAKT